MKEISDAELAEMGMTRAELDEGRAAAQRWVRARRRALVYNTLDGLVWAALVASGIYLLARVMGW